MGGLCRDTEARVSLFCGKDEFAYLFFAPHEAVQTPENKISFLVSTLQALLSSKRLMLPAKLSSETVRSHAGMRIMEIILSAPARPFATSQRDGRAQTIRRAPRTCGLAHVQCQRGHFWGVVRVQLCLSSQQREAPLHATHTYLSLP